MKKLLITSLSVVITVFPLDCSQSPSSNPILILAPIANFGTYTAEILKAEGFNAFTLESPSNKKLTYSYLKKFDLIILAECKIDPAITEILEKYAHKGGNLIAFRKASSTQGREIHCSPGSKKMVYPDSEEWIYLQMGG